MSKLNSMFDKYATRVKASVSTPKDVRGVSTTVKLTVAPKGDIGNDKAWLEAAESGIQLTQKQKEESGRARSKSLKLDDKEGEDCRVIVAEVLGVEATKKRTGRADTVPSENGQHTEEASAN